MFKSHCVVHSLVIRECRWMGRACACMQTFVSRTCESESSKPDARYRFHRSHNMEASQYTRSYNAPSFPYWWPTPLLQYLINRSSLIRVLRLHTPRYEMALFTRKSDQGIRNLWTNGRFSRINFRFESGSIRFKWIE